jgi:tight adherence protein B
MNLLLDAAITARGEALLAMAGVSVIILMAVWLLVTSASRRGTIADRGVYGPARSPRLDERLDAWLEGSDRGAGLTTRLRAAGSKLTAGRFVLVCVGSAAGAFFVVQLLFPPVLALVGGVLAVVGCLQWLSRRLEKRKEMFVAQLPEVARLLSNGASAGLSVPAGLELCVREIQEPAHSELQLVIDELALGRSLDEALERLGRRIPSREVSVLLTTLIIQQRAGGDAVQALQELAGTLDERRNTLREVATLIAGAVYTSYMVPLLGLGALLLLNTINQNTLHEMTTKPLGIAVLVVSGTMYAVGWMAIRKATRIEL